MLKKKEFLTKNEKYQYFDLEKLSNKYEIDLKKIPYSIRILIENIMRKSSEEEFEKNAVKILNWKKNTGKDISFYPARIVLQDYTGVPCVVDIASMRDAAKEMGLAPNEINPEIPVDLVIDHSVQVDQAGNAEAMAFNVKREFERNSERYELLKWAQKSFTNFKAIPPDTGIIHQINIEYLSPVVQEKDGYCYPDSVFGTDSHTTMINGLGVLGWGVGGLEAEACMLGEPSVFSIPEVIGVKLKGKLPAGCVATDLALTVTHILRQQNAVGKFVEYFGPGYESLSLADRATISNMSPEYGSTCGYFPFDQHSSDYLELTGRSRDTIEKIISYMKHNQLFYNADEADQIEYSQVVEIDLDQLSSKLSGPKRPQDTVNLKNLPYEFTKAITYPLGNHGFGLKEEDVDKTYDFQLNGKDKQIKTGDVLIAAITSCTNTSNPSVLLGAGLLAKKAVEKGLTVDEKVKTSFAPGSQAVSRYLKEAGLSTYLDQLGFNIIAYGCTTCIGNSGPLAPEIEAALSQSDVVAGAVLSGNRNFEGRIHPLIKANYLGSPLLVIAYALAGNLKIDLQNEPIGFGKNNEKVYLKDIWPTSTEIGHYESQYVSSDTYKEAYKNIFSGTDEWDQLEVSASETYTWCKNSTYIANPPYFEEQIAGKNTLPKLKSMRVLVKLGDSVTTDHISPAGNIAVSSPAGKYLKERNIKVRDFNSYGSRRGNHHIMTRGTLANVRLHNELAKGKEGGYTTYFPTDEVETIFSASQAYQKQQTELLIIAGKDYGMGSSRDWAAKGVKLLGVKAVIAESYERIHRSNLVMMGVVPLQFEVEENAASLGLDGSEIFEINLADDFKPRQKVTVKAQKSDGQVVRFETIVRFDSEVEVAYYQSGGILNKILADKLAE